MKHTLGFAALVLAASAMPALAQDAAPEPVPGQTVWILNTLLFLIGGFLVMFMAAGFCMLEAGLVRSKNTAEILKDVMRAEDHLIRSGGDEFLAILPGIVDASVLDKIAGRILKKMAEGRKDQDFLSASIGVAVRNVGETEDLATLIARADSALYASKSQGPGRATLTSQQHISSLSASG